ncbi:acetyltransferase [Amycolatopsis arida]|uniref:Phthiocerol/phthiodiolone dimycocerosyl transferase n=1 Tax=Amycolatopsis arida TaxID=587909 RepID=A0A1I5P2Y1_9PSEU|nr:hypothetical protein [Amycolatopsis arida]TDX98330.1 acetyltransferase [Amycolatopsis arida]SFP28210.1 acetyltransferase [Amycolatopsis arida]
MTTERPLAPSEAFHAAMGWSGTYSVVSRGQLDVEAMTRAFDALCAEAPLLRARIGRTGSGFRFRVADQGPPDVSILRPGQGSYLDELVRPLDPDRGLARLTVLRGDELHHVVLVLHHAIADAGSGVAQFGRLWRHYTAVVRGQPPAGRVRHELPPPAEELLFARGWAKPPGWDDAAVEATHALAAAAGAVPAQPVVADRVRLDPDETARLTGRARTAGLSVHALVSGCLLVACREELTPGDEPVRVVCGSPADLRGRVTPPVPAIESTNVLSGINTRVMVARGADPVAVGKDVGAQLEASLAAGEPFATLLDSRRFATPDDEPVDYVVSNLGALPPFESPAGLDVTDFRGFQTITLPGLLLYVVSSYLGRLSVDLVTPAGYLTDQQRTRITERGAELLRQAAEWHPEEKR